MRKSKIQNLHPSWIKLGVEGTIPIYDKILNEIILLFNNKTVPRKKDLREIVKAHTSLNNAETIRRYANAYAYYIVKNKLVNIDSMEGLF